MNIEEILDQLDDLLDKAWSLPLSGGRCVVDAEKVRDLLDDVRLNLPTEIKQAKAIVVDRTDIITTAKREAEAIVRKAEDRARAMIAQEEVVKQSQLRAAEIISQAQNKSREMRQASQEFSDNLLKQTEDTMLKALSDIKTCLLYTSSFPRKRGLSLCIKNTATARKKSPCIEKRKHNWKRELRSAPAALTPSLWDTWTLSAGRPPCLTR